MFQSFDDTFVDPFLDVKFFAPYNHSKYMVILFFNDKYQVMGVSIGVKLRGYVTVLEFR
jgi:hypothetical protein